MASFTLAVDPGLYSIAVVPELREDLSFELREDGGFELEVDDSADLLTGSAGPSVGSSISGGYFSRKRWHEIISAREAERAAREKAEHVKQAPHRKKLLEAAAAAKRAIDAAEAQEEARVNAHLERIARTVAAAAGATKLADVIRHSEGAVRHVERLLQQIEDDDEEEAITLLLMH